ncbi:MAG: hypothetical protein R3321_10280 [Nitrososphaeraceae archaeon]|nr:hypothetical protein [Nitrososphaeraceae archaeon]
MRSIPPSVKLEILKAYLNGFSHREIAKESRISLGSVSNVLESLRSERKEFDELRELAQTIKSNNLLLSRMFEATNFLLWLRRNDIKLEFVMNMLDYMNTEGFRFDINIEYFFHRLCSLLIYEKSIGIKIEDLLYLIEEKIGEKQKIEEEINKLYNVYGVTKKQLQEYKNNKALFENFINLQNIYTIPMGKNVIKNEFDYENV